MDRVAAPWWPVAAATGFALAAVALALANWLLLATVSVPLLALGYVVGALAPTVLASVYRALRNSRRRHPKFRVQPGLDRLALTAMTIGVVAGLVNAVLLATELAK
jgi:hypothetical protein